MNKLFGIALVAVVSPSILAAPPAGPSYTFHYQPQVHKHLHYGMQMKMQAMSITADFTMTATSFKDGKYTIETVYNSMQIPSVPPEQVQKMLAGTKITQLVDKNGNILKTTASGMLGQMGGGGGMGVSGSVFSRSAVHVGDTWTGSTKVNGKETKVKVRLLGVKRQGSGQLATLQMTQTSGEMAGSPVVVTVDPATGTMHSMHMSGKSPQGTVDIAVQLK